jgi:hypothetical protein
MSRSPSIHRFNNIVKQFGEKMARTFPKDPDSYVFQSQIELAIALNKWKVYNGFVTYVLDESKDYRERIMNDDERFFMESKVELDDDNYIEKALQLRKKWKKLKKENKAMIFKFFKVLIILAERVQEERKLENLRLN